MNRGSFFLAEICLTIFSSSPGGVESVSIGVTNPYGYSRSVNAWIVFSVVLMLPPRHPSLYPILDDGDKKSRIYFTRVNSYLDDGLARRGRVSRPRRACVPADPSGSLRPVIPVPIVAVTVGMTGIGVRIPIIPVAVRVVGIRRRDDAPGENAPGQ